MRGLPAWLLIIVLLPAGAQAAPDYAREQRWADEVTPGLVVGDPVYLAQPSGHRFLAIYAATAKPRAAVIVVHGMGVHPDWNLIGALRSGLVDSGYATLAIQMPVLEAGALGESYRALFPDAAERLQLAAAFLRAQGHQRIALVSHSMGSVMSNYFLTGAADHGIIAWVSIGIISSTYTDAGKLRLPVLDIYGERDTPQVLQRVDARAQALKALKGSAQIEVAGADHYFTGSETELVRQARQFLDQRFR